MSAPVIQGVPVDPVYREDNKSPAQWCASYDVGGGVALGDSFAIYSITAFLPDRSRIRANSTIYAELTTAAFAVTGMLPVLVHLRDMASDLVSLPCPTHHSQKRTGKSMTVDCFPWYLINAGKYSKHCVVGRDNIVESLLVVLQRPWCVLELCCCDTPTIAAIHGFATVAMRIDRTRYRSAVRLISHELTRRTGDQAENLEPCRVSLLASWRDGKSMDQIWNDVYATYADLSQHSLRSHNGFWLCLISVCAVYLGVACSELVQQLWDAAQMPALVSAVPPSKSSLRENWDVSFSARRSFERRRRIPRDNNRLRRYRSEPSLWCPGSVWQTNHILEIPNPSRSDNNSDHRKCLIALSRGILRRIGSCVL